MPKISKLDQARLELFSLIPHCAPDFMEEPWIKNNKEQVTDPTDIRHAQDWNNCYSYAANDPEIYRCPKGVSRNPAWPIPGMEDQPINSSSVSLRKLRLATIKNGFIYAGRKLPEPKPGTYIVAAYVCKHKDAEPDDRGFHYYRLDRSGIWSNKDGTGYPVNKDWLLQPITNVRKDAKKSRHYKDMQFVGYFYAPNSGIILGRRDQVLKNPTSSESTRKSRFNEPDIVQTKMTLRHLRQRVKA